MRPLPEQSAEKANFTEVPLQLLLFVDKRPTATEQIRQIRNHLKALPTNHRWELQTIDVGEQPYLAEHFKLIATPALIKIHPEPQHTLAGGNLVTQLQIWWPRWQQSVEAYVASQSTKQSEAKDLEANSHSFTDAAELIKLSDEIFRLKQEQEALQEQLQFKDRIIAMLAHDLRNPLTAASIALETLEAGLNHSATPMPLITPEMQVRLIGHIRNQTQIMDRMITNILQTDQGETDQLRINPQKLDLRSLCREVLERFNARLDVKGQYLAQDIPTDLPAVYADGDRIHQVLLNLLDNATKYTPEGGTIQVTVLHRTSQKVQISICDNGLGIPVENQTRIFDNQFRLQRDQNQDGYGIGLGLCQRIIRAHYGQIWVDSNPNEGSCFHFTLPVHWG
jgi:two-component system, OmpR family, clock-associated histidine kinase SasA